MIIHKRDKQYTLKLVFDLLALHVQFASSSRIVDRGPACTNGIQFHALLPLTPAHDNSSSVQSGCGDWGAEPVLRFC